VENRLHSVAGEQYLYDENGIRIKKTVGATTTFYPFGHYEVSGTTVKKYYTFGGMTVAMRTGSTLKYLHTDHLGGVAAVTTSAGAYSTNQSYFAYGKKRAGGTLPTTINYTGQRLDGSGLVYMNARYYDPLVGMFISPDTIVPDAGVLIDYNRFAYGRANPLKYNDPSGHQASCTMSASGEMSCSDNAVTGGTTLQIDLADGPPDPNPDGMRQLLTTVGGLLVVSIAAPFAVAYLPEAAIIAKGAGTAACGDLDCTNEANALIQGTQRTTYSINWLGGQTARIQHILAPKHEWGRVVNLSGDLSDDYNAIQPFIQQAVDSGSRTVLNQSSIGPVVQFVNTINNQQVVVRGIETAQRAIQITDAWVAK